MAENLETAERLLEQCAQHRASCMEACASTIVQGEALLRELRESTDAPDTTGSVSFIFQFNYFFFFSFFLCNSCHSNIYLNI